MCIYSLTTGQRTTKAKVGVILTVTDHQHHTVLTNPAGQLQCVSHGSVMQAEAVAFRRNVVGSIYQPDGSVASAQMVLKWAGKADVTVKLVRLQERSRYASDAIELPDGVRVPLGWLVAGTRMVRVRAVRKDKGISKPRDLSKVLGLDQIKADIPVKRRQAVKG